jgi:hypothetical protein
VLHTSPQLPQLPRSVVVSSHSVGLATGQAVSPAVQESEQPPLTQMGEPVPFVGPAQTVPQPPQLVGSDCSFTHSVGLAVGQPLKPVLHTTLHAPLVHAGFPLAAPGHVFAQPPQWVGSVCSFTHAVGAPVGHPL